MDGISLIGLPLLELEELDVLVELATEDEDRLDEPRIWWDGGGGGAKINVIKNLDEQALKLKVTQGIGATNAHAFDVKSADVSVSSLVDFPSSPQYPRAFHVRSPILQMDCWNNAEKEEVWYAIPDW